MKVGPGVRTKESNCPSCGTLLDAAAEVEETNAYASPAPGDFTICLACGHLMAFADDLSLRNLTSDEMHEVAGDQRIKAIQRARRALRS